jgi:hypothetical protein
MRSRTLVVVAGCLALAALTAPAGAEHTSAPAPERGSSLDVLGQDRSLDIDLKLGLDGFRLGSRVFGRDGYAGGAWLNGETRPDGFSLDGRIERNGKAHNFKFNAEFDAWLRRAWRWGGMAL